jgi:hypothetical protein
VDLAKNFGEKGFGVLMLSSGDSTNNEIHQLYVKYLGHFGKFCSESNAIINNVITIIEHLPKAYKIEVTNLIVVPCLQSQSVASKHILQSVLEQGSEKKIEEILKATNLCNNGLAKSYLSAISILVSIHRHYSKKYGNSIPDLSEKNNKIGQANILYTSKLRDIESGDYFRDTDSSTYSSALTELKDAFQDCFDICSFHHINRQSYKNLGIRFCNRVFVLTTTAVGGTFAICTAVILNLPDDTKQRIINKICKHVAVCDKDVGSPPSHSNGTH